MKSIIALFLMSFIAFAGDFYAYKLKNSDGKEIDFSSFKGKTLLVVNIATKCGFTGQLDEMEAIYKKYKDKNFVVLGIPSNDFKEQTPEENKEVGNFCRLKYGASFPITEKLKVVGKEKHSIIEYLVKNSDGEELSWNFNKFLVDGNGKIIKRYSSFTSPDSSSITEEIEKLIK